MSHGSRERYLEPIATMNQALPKAQKPTKPVTTASIRMLETTHTENETDITHSHNETQLHVDSREDIV